MKASFSRIASFIRNLADNRRGVSGVLSVIALPVLVGVAGYAIDIGHALQVQRALQASTDAAALAGAHYINSATASPIAAATTYGAESGSRNAVKGATVTMVSGYPKLECLTSVGQNCNGPNSANAIQVKQRAVIQTWFSQAIGIDTFTVTVSSTATAGGSQALPLDIMVVMDTTASMNDPDPNCPISGATRLTCALAGLRTLLQLLNPSDQVGLMTFPGVTNSTQAAYDYACNSTTPTTVAYDDSPDYQIVGLANDFIVSGSPPTLSDSSDLVLAAQGGPTGCTQGLKAAGGYGTYYADVIAAAQTALMSDGRANVQKVIILLSDGDANAKPQNMPPDKASNQCHEAITAAANATAAGTWVYSLAYGASADATPGSCSTDSPAISACSTMQQIASKPAFFYSDQSGGTGSCTSAANSVSELMGIFGAVGKSFQKPRLVLDSTN